MNDYELYYTMRKMGFTEEGAMDTIEVRNEYSALYPYYDEYMGNFGFTEKDLEHLMPLVLKWIKAHKDYVLLYDNNNADEECVWWLTTEY